MVTVKVTARNMCVGEEISFLENQKIYDMLLKLYPDLQGEKNIYVSDLFPKDFLYKPISLEQIYVDSDDEYRMLKKLKKAKYIEKSILDRVCSGKEVVKMLMKDEASLRGNAICEVREKLQEFLFDFYITLPVKYKELLDSLKQFTLNQVEFEVEDVEVIEPQKNETGYYVLQSSLKVENDWFIYPESESLFRVCYREEEGCQYFKEGSVFEDKDRVFSEKNQGVRAYIYPMRRKKNAE